MKTQNIVFRAVLTLLSALIVTSCSKEEGKSAKADVTILPEKPIVITADINDGTRTIKAPWFEFQAKMKNDTEEPITIIAVQLEISGLDESGTIQKTTTAVAPSEYNFQLTDEVTCEFTYFGTFAVGKEEFLTLEGADLPCYVIGKDGDGKDIYGSRTPIFRVASNPVGGPGKNNFNYNVTMKPLGWFGTRSDPTDRFDKTVNFYTE